MLLCYAMSCSPATKFAADATDSASIPSRTLKPNRTPLLYFGTFVAPNHLADMVSSLKLSEIILPFDCQSGNAPVEKA